jgi:hypothetical protein
MRRLAPVALLVLLATRGGSAGGATPADPYTPEQFPVAVVFKGKPASPILKSKEALLFRTRIREGAKSGPNFAGHYTLISWGCGTSCQQYALVDAVNGHVFDLPFRYVSSQPAYGISEGVDVDRLPDFGRSQASPKSRLFVVGGCFDEDEKRCGWHFYEMTEKGLSLLKTVPFPPLEALPRALR